ncbi:MAG: carboxylating nicotinate-nucleotide diphosphorylase [Verrucomicrobia bacterium]|nr:carboxylating nicotinate-nucleotide diphosphorylase [Verrucomicrobiota bacterium]
MNPAPASASTPPPPPLATDPIALALAEDLGETGDVTVQFFVTPGATARARIFAKESAVVAGATVAAETFRRVGPTLAVEVLLPDGSRAAPGDTVLTIAGPAGALLSGERVALNFLQRLSGVATLTARFVAATHGLPVKILDTRKTTPGLRALEKAAVRAGGGTNHRLGLHDMVMVKDNHLLAGVGAAEPAALQAAIDRARAARPGIGIELEADTLSQVETFLALRGVDWILLDNMTPAAMCEAVAQRAALGSRVRFEASGGINLETVRAAAESGVDAISVGALTHSARAIDFSLEFLPGDVVATV